MRGGAKLRLVAARANMNEKRLHTAVYRHSHDSRVTLHCVACGRVIERTKEGRKEGRKEGERRREEERRRRQKKKIEEEEREEE